MNLKTTIVLLVLLVTGGLLAWLGPSLTPMLSSWLDLGPRPVDVAGAGTLTAFADELKPEKLTRIEIPEQLIILERSGQSDEWNMPGNWPTRKPEVEELVQTLTTKLTSRFVPIPLLYTLDRESVPKLEKENVPDDILTKLDNVFDKDFKTGEEFEAALRHYLDENEVKDHAEKLLKHAREGGRKKYGLDKPLVMVRVRAGKTEHTLEFGKGREELRKGDQQQSNPFSAPTFVCLDDKQEVIRLAPGVVDAFLYRANHYQHPRLFPRGERSKAGGDSPGAQDSAERLAAKDVTQLAIKAPGKSYTLAPVEPPAAASANDEWKLIAPVTDRIDPDKLKSIREVIPDIWAEVFVEKPKKDLAEYGLKEPDLSITLTKPSGDVMTLLIGKTSPHSTKRTVIKPSPPGIPMPPQKETITEEFRYAKLKDNDQIFEIKFEKPGKEVFVAVDTLRDARLARFRSDDARRVEITQGDKTIVLAKEKERWRLQKPLEADGESSKINELLDKLSNLQASDKDIIDKADVKTYGLDKPAASVKVAVEEEIKGEGDSKTKKNKTFTFQIGKHDTDKKKLYIRMDGWERINAVEDSGRAEGGNAPGDSVLALVNRPALAYRGRRLLDFNVADLETVEVQRGDEKITLKKGDKGWRLTVPVDADADRSHVDTLTSSLSSLEVVEFVNDAKPEQHGLDKPALSAKLTFSGDPKATKPAKAPISLLVGKQRGDKPEYFARLDDGKNEVFIVRKDVHDALDRGSLAYRPTQLWQMTESDLAAVSIKKEGQPSYQLTRKDKRWKISGPFEADAETILIQPMEKELASARSERYETHTAKELAKFGLDKPYLTVTVQPKAKKEKVKEHTLQLGKKLEKGGRFAKVEGSDAVVVVGESFVKAVDHGALDLLNPVLLELNATSMESFKSSGKESFTIQKQGKQGTEWKVVEGPAAPFTADSQAMGAMMTVWSSVRAKSYADYGPKVDLAKYGLDKPTQSVTISVKKAHDSKELTKHTLALGKAVEGKSWERYARLDNGPGVVVLGMRDVEALTQTRLDFVDRTVFQFDSAAITALQRQEGETALELSKEADGWQLKAQNQRADDEVVKKLVDQLAKLRAHRVAAYPVKELKTYGLDKPVAIWSAQLMGGARHILKIGNEVDAKTGDRYALSEGSKAVVVLHSTLARQLLAGPVAFRNRELARFADADKIHLERGQRKAVFAKVEGSWKLTEPLKADAEQTELEELINAVARLRADELVAEKPADWKIYGLDKPTARWRFQSGDKDVLNLLIGSPEKIKTGDKETDGPRRYARLADADIVFLLDPKLTARMLDEYRSRTIWNPSVDAAQVESINFAYSRNPFTLEKADNTWKVAGKPDVKIKPEAVSETLAALSTLRVERYVVDKGADLKLYGLEPAQLVLRLRTPSGESVIHVGNREGESKRYYAHLPGENRTEVFVISEADAGKIVRELAAFMQK